MSLVFAQSEMLQKEVYLFERIDNSRSNTESMKYLKCLVFLRPIEENIDLLRRELKSPRFGQYNICQCFYFKSFQLLCISLKLMSIYCRL